MRGGVFTVNMFFKFAPTASPFEPRFPFSPVSTRIHCGGRFHKYAIHYWIMYQYWQYCTRKPDWNSNRVPCFDSLHVVWAAQTTVKPSVRARTARSFTLLNAPFRNRYIFHENGRDYRTHVETVPTWSLERWPGIIIIIVARESRLPKSISMFFIVYYL